MVEESKNEQKSVLRKGASATHAVNMAYKAGKYAASGPYGVIAGALWQERKGIGKVAAALVLFFILPIVILSMLPSLLFGGVGNSHSFADPDHPVLNSAVAVTENVNDITFAINSILAEGLEDVNACIVDDFMHSTADKMEIINPYAEEQIHNTNRIVAIYCASKSQDIGEISLPDLEEILRDHVKDMLSYTWREECRERIEKDPETGEESCIKETFRVYTISYNGEDYLEDCIFKLTEDQKELAVQYATNMSLFIEDGLIQNYDGWVEARLPALGDIRYTDGATEVVYYNQLDERYAWEAYGTDMIGGYGCGPTAMAIVVSSLAGEVVNPVDMAQWSYDNGYWCKGGGSYLALIPAAAENWGLNVEGCSASEPQKILDALTDGKLVVAIMSKGHFTSSGHFIVLRGVIDGKILVADPASYNRSGQQWDLSIILDEASRGAAAGGPFWIIG